MLRKPEDCIVLTFQTTAAAMAAEAAAGRAGLPGRMIPTPREITAGCGLSWRAPWQAADETRAALEQAQVEVAGWYRLTI